MNAIDPNTSTPVNDLAVAPAAAPASAEPKASTPTVVATSTEAVKAARYASANAALEQAAKDSAAKVAADAIAAANAEQAKASETVTAAKLAQELAEAKAKADMLTPKADLAAKLEHAQALAKDGKHYEAIQFLSESTGISFDNAVQQLVNPGQAPVPAAKPDDKPVDPEVAKLKADLEAVNKRLADADAAVAAAAKEAGRRSVVEHVKATAKDFPYLASNEEWVTKALADAEPDYAKAIAENKGQDISAEAKNDIVIKALAKAEANHKAMADAYKAVGSPALAVKTPTDVPKMTQPTLTITSARAGLTPAVKTGKAATLEELKLARRSATN